MHLRLKVLVGATVAALAVALPSGTAVADKVKDCGTTETATSPNDNAQGTPFVTTETETQTAACNSNSDTGEVIVTETTNRGGHPK